MSSGQKITKKELTAWAVVDMSPEYKIPVAKHRSTTDCGYVMDSYSVFRTRDLARRALNRAKISNPKLVVKNLKVVKIKIII